MNAPNSLRDLRCVPRDVVVDAQLHEGQAQAFTCRRSDHECSAVTSEGLVYSLTFRVGSVENAEATAALADSAAIAGLAATLPTEACLATLPDSHFGVRLGREVAFVGDYEVEIAAKAAAANPVVKTTFDGFRISGMLRQSAGKSRVELRLQWGAVAPFAPIDLANPALGTADTPVTAWTDVEQSVGLAGEGWQIAHLQPDPSAPGERSLVLMVRTR